MGRQAFTGILVALMLVGAGCDPVRGKSDASSPDSTECTPECADRQCGPDGCGGTCGRCGDGLLCNSTTGTCGTCLPVCEGRVCGDDGCGGLCGTCTVGKRCDAASGTCLVCTPNCGTATCGDDGCGGVCGTCGADETCNALKRTCIPKCQPDCTNKECGDNGCGGSCGTCPGGADCLSGVCQSTSQDVIETGDEGPQPDVQPPTDTLVELPTDTDTGRDEAGADATPPDVTPDFQCVRDCYNRQCGSDGCGGSCGSCPGGYTCVESESSGTCEAIGDDVIVPTDVRDVLADTPTEVRDVPAEVKDVPSEVKDVPAEVRDVQDPGPDTTPVCVDDPVGSCKAAYECIGDCPVSGGQKDPACRAQCEDEMSTNGQAIYNAFNQCLQVECSGATTNEEFYACLEEKCLGEYLDCFSGCEYGTCLALNGCEGACPRDNAATPDVDEASECRGDCNVNATPEAQLAAMEGQKCALAKCPICSTATTDAQYQQCNDCYYSAASGTCASKFAPCAMYDTCADFTECMANCPADNPSTPNANEAQQCTGACFSLTMPLGQLQRIDAEQCNFEACPICDKEDPTNAEIEQCNTCWGEAGTGSCASKWAPCSRYATCAEFTECMAGCPADNPSTPSVNERQQCSRVCFQLTTPLGQAQRIDAEQCSIDACPVCEKASPTEAEIEQCNTCWETSMTGTCASQWSVCQ